jgi:hypothetical protein
MKSSIFYLPCLALALSLGTARSSAQSTNSPGKPDFSSFKIILQRNIFNPRRYGPSVRPPQAPASRVDAFTLVGTMSYDKGDFAFFEGTSPELRKVAKVSDAIAGYKITNIAYNSVTLSGATNELQLPVGMQMRREDGGTWHLAKGSEVAISTAGSDSRSSNGSSANGGELSGTNGSQDSTAGGSDDAILKKLMQRREQENNR